MVLNCFVPVQIFHVRQKNDLHYVPTKGFVPDLVNSVFGSALIAIQFLVLPKIFGPAQNILGPVKRQVKKL